MPLLDRNGWKTDDYVRYDAFFDAPAIIVPAELIDTVLEQRQAGQRIGVEIANTIRADQLAQAQDRLDLIAVNFPKFSDGRGFSIGRSLRDQGYKGVLRVAGPIIPDQFAFALHCGFDEVEIGDAQAERQPVEQWLQALTQFHESYQDTQDGMVSILKRRRNAA